MTTRKTYTAEFKRQAIELQNVRMLAPYVPLATSESVPPCFTAGASRLKRQGKRLSLVRVERP